MLRAVDLFCGAGGTTTGAEQSGRVKVVLAVNHWQTAIQTHRANHPHVRHVCAPIDLVDPRDFAGDGLDVVMASPECIFHSNARGGKPVDDQRRATAWCVPRWAEVLRPKWLVIENVREFLDWAPLGANNKPLKSRKGEIFAAWVNALRALNYQVEWRLLNAADYGGATKRVRLFIVGRRGPSRQPIPWPAPTHSRDQWMPAASIIDWSLPCPSIFGRKHPLAEKTLRRIEIGLRKFCGPGAEPFIVRLRTNSTAASVGEQLGTISAGAGHHALAMPCQMQLIGRGAGQMHGINEPSPTIIAARENHGIVQPFLSTFHNGEDGERRNSSLADSLPVVDTQNRQALVAPFSVDQPLGSLTTLTTHHGKSLVLPFLTSYFANGKPQSVDDPLSTVTTKHRHGLAMVRLIETMQQLGIVDVGFRMLQPHELAAAQGFPASYKIYGTKADQVKQIGNSVHTAVAKALCDAIGRVA